MFMKAFTYVANANGYHFFCANLRDSNGDCSVLLLVYRNKKLVVRTNIPNDKLERGINSLSTKLPGFRHWYTDNNQLVSQVLFERISKGELEILPKITTLGWQSEENRYCRYAGAQLYSQNGQVLFHELAPDFPKMNGLETNYRETWDQLLNNWAQNHIERQTVLAVGLAAPLAGLMKKNILVALIGDSSTGKTSAASLATSFFQTPQNNLTFNATQNALVEQLYGNQGVPILIDDTSLIKNIDINNLIYSLANGVPRLRFRHIRHKHEDCWLTSIFITAEKSILDNSCDDLNGVVGRVIEIPIFKNILFDNSLQAQAIKEFYNTFNGVIGARFVQHLLKKEMHNIKKQYSNIIEKLNQENIGGNNILFRQIEKIALVGLAANIANKIGLHFDSEGIMKYLVECVNTSIDCKEIAKSSCLTAKEIVEQGIQDILDKNHPDIQKSNQGRFLAVSSSAWKTFVKNSGLGVHEIHRIRRELGYDDDTASINNKLYRGFYLDKEVK